MGVKEVGVFSLALVIVSIMAFSIVFAAEGDEVNISADESEESPDNEDALEETSPFEDNEEEDISEIDSSEEDDSEDLSAELSVGAGITPDSTFYFVEDQILSRFRDDLTNREKKIAEIEVMVKEGNIEAAEESLERYRRYAERSEENIAPDEKDEALRSAAAIRNAIREIEDEIPSEDKKDFVDDVLDKEEEIKTAAEIAAKIKDLCETLSKIDPKKYAQTCKTDDDAPKWHRDLDKKLTNEQKKEAIEFGEIMSECMQTEGKRCRCEDISIKPFAEKCSLVAPLATKCEEGDDEACEIMDEATQGMEELLPPHLQEVLFDIEDDVRGDQFDHFMPPECEEAGARSREDCMKVMFELNAPEECAEAAEKGDIDFSNERSMRESCERIMFLDNAPDECIEAGLKDHRECGKYMCENNLPEECKSAGLSCEQPQNVFRKCDTIMRESRMNEGGKGQDGPGNGFAFGRDCRSIEDKDEKLKCFEEIFNNVQERGFPGRGPENFGRGFDERGNSGGGFPPECIKAGIDGRNPDDGEKCHQLIVAQGESRHQQTRDYQENFARDCRAKGGRWDCSFGDIDSSNPCRCYVEEQRDYRDFGSSQEWSQFPPECQSAGATTRESCERVMREQFRPPEQQPPSGFEVPLPESRPPEQQPPSGEQPPLQTSPPPQPIEGTSGGTTSGEQQGTSSGSGSESGTTGESGATTTTSESSVVTGGVIALDNKFLDYFFNR